MNEVQSEFNFGEGQRRKAKGQDLAAAQRRELLAIARREAQILYRKLGRPITADDVQRRMMELGFRPRDLANAAGSIFRGKHWEKVGIVESTRVTNHSRVVRQWRLVG